MTTMGVFRKVSSGELSVERGADILAEEKPVMRQPSWAPAWAWLVVLVLAAVVLGQVTSRDRRA